MRSISATEFKAKCLALIDEVGATDEVIIIEKRGRPVAQLQKHLPLEQGSPQLSLRGTVKVNADITKPVLSAELWDAHAKKT